MRIEPIVRERNDTAADSMCSDNAESKAGAMHQRASRKADRCGLFVPLGPDRINHFCARPAWGLSGQREAVEQRVGVNALLIEHAFGHTRCSAGTQHVEIRFCIGLATKRRIGRNQRFDAVPLSEFTARSVVDLYQPAQLRQTAPNRRDAIRKLCVINK